MSQMMHCCDRARSSTIQNWRQWEMDERLAFYKRKEASTGGRAYVARVADTGAPELEVDLPDATWQAVTGLDPAVGVAYAEVDVMILEVRGGVAVVNGQIGGRP